jgi:hypothetical protein
MTTRLRTPLWLTGIACTAWLGPVAGMAAEDFLRIIRQPQSQTRVLPDIASFSIAVESSRPELSFQWERIQPPEPDWTPIPGAVSSNYTVFAESCSQSKTLYRCRVSIPLFEVTSDAAELTVICDCAPPAVTRASASASLDGLIVEFSDPIIPDTATDIFNYSIDGLEVVEARMLDPRTVALTTGPQLAGHTYTLYTTNISDYGNPDCGANLVSPFIGTPFTAAAWVAGLLRREFFGTIPGHYLTDLTSHPKFPLQPDAVSHVASFEAPRMIDNNYGTRLSGFLLPPVSGDYHFFLASDGLSELRLSTDEAPSNATLIASIGFRSGWREWANASGPIRLEHGKRYYVEALMKEDFGWDYLSVAWQLPGGQVPREGRDVIPGTYLGIYAAAATALQIVHQPRPAYGVWDCQASFTVEVQVQPPNAAISYQWQRDGEDIPGANAATHVTGYLNGADNGATFRCRISAPGLSLLSDEVMIILGGDVSPPKLEGAFAWDTNHVALIFNHPVVPSDPDSFQFTPGLNVQSTTLHSSDPAIVLVRTAPMNPTVRYRVTVSDLQDTSGNTLSPNPSEATFNGPLPSPAPDELRVVRAGSKLIVLWNDPAVLQSSESPRGPWQDLDDATSPAVFGPRPDFCDAQPHPPRRFFRLRTSH